MESMIQMAWPFILMAAIFYMMIYRPQKRDQKKRADMLNALKVGTRIVTIGGIFGVITKVQEDKLRIKVAENVEFHIRRSAVGTVLTSTFDKDNSPKEETKEEVKEEAKAPEAAKAEAPAENAADAAKAEPAAETSEESK